MEKIAGVYMIQSISHPERQYVGSAVDIDDRQSHHFSLLRKNKHHSPILQNHYNKYGKEDLAFDIIESGEYLDDNHLRAREQMWIGRQQYKDTEKPYFNICPIAGSNLGTKWSEESKLNFRHPKSEEHKANLRHPKSEEHKAKLMGNKNCLGKQNNKGKHWKQSQEACEAKSIKMTGLKREFKSRKSPSAETIEKIRNKNIGKFVSEETKEKQKQKKLGILHSEEYRNNQSIAITEWWRLRKINN